MPAVDQSVQSRVLGERLCIAMRGARAALAAGKLRPIPPETPAKPQDARPTQERFVRLGKPANSISPIDGDKMTPSIYTARRQRLGNLEHAMTGSGKRITTRVTDHVQEKLQTAADLVGATLNQFVVQAALERAERVIESESTMVLTRRESLRLLEMIENPPPRNEKFLRAQARYRKAKSHAGSVAA